MTIDLDLGAGDDDDRHQIGTADFETLVHRFFRQGWWRSVLSSVTVADCVAQRPHGLHCNLRGPL
jgi:hypothetical protein